LHWFAHERSFVNILGKANKAIRIFAFPGLQFDPFASVQAGRFDRIVRTPSNAHWNCVTLLQLLSLPDIDPVASMMMAMFHGVGLPSIDANDVAFMVKELTPKIRMNVVGMLTCSVTWRALALELVVHLEFDKSAST
jgi:hypothetical protein